MENKQIRKFFSKNEVSDETDKGYENWLQKIIAICIKIGITKKAFMEDYYPDEIPIIMNEYAELNNVNSSKDKEVTADAF